MHVHQVWCCGPLGFKDFAVFFILHLLSRLVSILL